MRFCAKKQAEKIIMKKRRFVCFRIDLIFKRDKIYTSTFRSDNMRIAIITAMAEEALPIFKKFGNVVAQNTISGVSISQIEQGANTIYLATSGVGEIKAALAVQLLVDLFDVETVLNFGFVGAINRNLDLCELVAVGRVCHYQFDVTEVDTDRSVGQYSGMSDNYFYLDQTLLSNVLANVGKPVKVVTCASGDKFVANKQDKERLKKDFGADICEMELAGLAIACERNNIPLLSIKVVSDKAEEGANVSFVSIVEKGIAGYEKILPAILEALTSGASSLPPVKKPRGSVACVKDKD